MQNAKLWQRLLGVERTVIESVVFDEDAGGVVASVRPRKGAAKLRCGRCARRCPGYDQGDGRRRWRTLDLGAVPAWLEADSPRVSCPDHGVVVAQVPWARHDVGHTRNFDDMAAWLATHCSKSAVTELMRVAWRTVGSIAARVVADAQALNDPLAGLVRIGIDEISYKKGHKYLVVIVDHDSGNLVWAAPGRDKKTLGGFFDALGQQRCRQITLVSADGAEWIAGVVAARCPNATVCMDPFHAVKWATDALDQVRRDVWNAARQAGIKTVAADLKGARYALWKNPEDLTANQNAKLSSIAQTNNQLFRAYLLKEQFRQVFRLRGDPGIRMLKNWLAWACRCQIPAFVALARTIRNYRPAIEAALTHGLTNARVESVNTKIRLLQRVAFGYRDPEALIAMAMLDLGGCCPDLPGRRAA
ncbi:MAG: ISL3 family transposase [Actinomycetota bacterium]|nr:ISL3 family transposase [Actinomycetota bacterium]